MTTNTESTYSSPDGRRLLARRMRQLERRIQIIRAALDESEPNLELVQEHMRVFPSTSGSEASSSRPLPQKSRPMTRNSWR
jgi:hypothetical protein